MKILGKMYLCERCGEQKFVKYIGSGPYRDGMDIHITADGFEAAVGWTKRDDKDFCSKCSEKYDSMMKEFLSCKE
mgnify:FL=1|jgi:hypothetical protein